MVEVTITGNTPSDPRSRVLAIEAAAQAMCEDIGADPAEGTMMLLTAAAHIAMKHARPGADTTHTLAVALGSAISAAEGFFKLREV